MPLLPSSYIHAVEPRLAGIADRDPTAEESNDFLRKIWGEGLYLAAGGFTREDAINTADTKGGLVVFGRYFISNVSVDTLLLVPFFVFPFLYSVSVLTIRCIARNSPTYPAGSATTSRSRSMTAALSTSTNLHRRDTPTTHSLRRRQVRRRMQMLSIPSTGLRRNTLHEETVRGRKHRESVFVG